MKKKTYCSPKPKTNPGALMKDLNKDTHPVSQAAKPANQKDGSQRPSGSLIKPQLG